MSAATASLRIAFEADTAFFVSTRAFAVIMSFSDIFSFSSSKSLAAVFLPMPGTPSKAAAFSVTIAEVMSDGVSTLNALRAVRGPIFDTVMSCLNIALSSCVTKP